MQRKIKRSVDVIISFCGLIILSPLLLLIYLVVRSQMGSPAIFKQPRPGLHGEIFNMYKFRTMTNDTDPEGNLLPSSERITPFGKFLRSTSLDELPELWNILKGDMSIVGPRPLLIRYLDLYSEEQHRRHDTLPGLTGWAQINGRNALSWQEKFELDVWYVDNWSLLLDFRIMISTARKLIKREGISPEDNVITPSFMGNDPTSKQ